MELSGQFYPPGKVCSVLTGKEAGGVPRASMDVLVKRKIAHEGHQTPVVQSVASHYIESYPSSFMIMRSMTDDFRTAV